MSLLSPGLGTTSDRPTDEPVERGLPRWLRLAARIAVPAGAVFSVALVLYAGRQNDSRSLVTFFVLWVVSPFIALALARAVLKRGRVAGQVVLYGLILVLTFASLAIYA